MGVCTADFERGVNGNQIAAADPGSATAWDSVNAPGASGFLHYDTAHAAHGKQAYKCGSGASAGTPNLIWSTALGTQSTTHYGRAYTYFTANPSQNDHGVSYQSGSAFPGWRISTAGKVLLLNGAGATVGTSTTSINLNGWTRLEWKLIQGTGTTGFIEVKIWITPDSNLAPTETLTSAGTNMLASVTVFRIGQEVSAANQGPAWFDDIMAGVTAGYPGPVTNPTQPRVVGQAVFRAATRATMVKREWRRTKSGILVPELNFG